MNFRNIEELKTKLMEISKRGFIKSHRKDNTGIGKTLEKVMDIAENNLPEGDFKIGKEFVELKAQRKDAKTPVTLVTKEPTWKRNKLGVIDKTGYTDKNGRKALKIILDTRRFNAKGYKLEIKGVFSNKRIAIVHNGLGEVCFFNLKTLTKLIKGKIGENLLLVLADVRKKGLTEYFHYAEAALFFDFNEKAFKKMIKKGLIIWEFRLHLKPSGAIRDYGSGFRIPRKFIPGLYRQRKRIL